MLFSKLTQTSCTRGHAIALFIFFNLLFFFKDYAVYGQTVVLDELKAFPTAEGYGKYVIGGNDGVVLKVTNLNNSGTGSLRAALEDSRPATIVFEVAGTILLNSSIVSKSNKTVAGETAFRNGGQGISIRMNPSRVFSTPLVDTGGSTRGKFGNHIWRYIRFRRGQGEAGENSGDNFSPWGNAGSFIMDHCSFMFSTDQNVSFPSVEGYTVQNSISAFGLAYSTHVNGGKHSKGSLTSDTPYCTWFRNLFSCNDDRNPLIQAKTSGITRVELINNFIYNRGIFGAQLQTYYGGTFHADIIGNYFKDGPNSNRNRWGFIWPGETTGEANNTMYYRNPQWAGQRVYVSGNLSPRRTSHNQEDWNFLGSWDDNSNAPQSSKAQHQVQFKLNDVVSNTAIIPAEDLESELLPDVGVSLYYDTFDAQAISFAINGTGSLVNGNGFSGGGFPEVSSLGPHPSIRNMSSVPADANDDGIDDDWADAHGISSAQQIKTTYDFGEYQVLNNARYTALEIYLAYLSKDFDRLDKEGSSARVSVTDVTISSDDMELNVRQTARLTASVAPSNATNSEVVWSSSNTAIATVDQNGNVTALTSGNTNIIAKSVANNNISDSVEVQVIAGQPTELWLEAECATVGNKWSVVDDGAASGGKYLLPSSSNHISGPPSDSGSIITYNFNVSRGTYRIYARAKTPSVTDDSFWIRVNGGDWILWNSIPGDNNFQWNQVHEDTNVRQPINFDLVEGTNILQIGNREDGAGLDKVYITNTGEAPNGFGQVDVTCTQNVPSENTELWLEAECANIGAKWSVIEDAAASGGSYLLPPSAANATRAPSDSGSIVTYNFNATEGIHRIYVRTRTPSVTDDSFWVRLNGGEWILWNSIPGGNSFVWNQVHEGTNVRQPISFNFMQGANTLQIGNREDGAGLDKIFITNTGAVPSGFGQTDSSCSQENTSEDSELWLEAECANVGANWSVITDATASGGKYLMPPVGNNFTEAPSDSGSIITYNFNAARGTYKIYARAMTPNGMDDSFWVRVNAGGWVLWNKIANREGFHWNQVHEGTEAEQLVTFNLVQGANTLQIAHREDGAGLDKVFISSIGTVPQGFGADDNTCISANAEQGNDSGEPQEITGTSLTVSLLNREAIAFGPIRIFPNPTRHSTVASFPENSRFATFELFSMSGTLVETGKIERDQRELTLSLVGVQNGVYILRLVDVYGRHVIKKIIKK